VPSPESAITPSRKAPGVNVADEDVENEAVHDPLRHARPLLVVTNVALARSAPWTSNMNTLTATPPSKEVETVTLSAPPAADVA
jgi:hypothetical protein